MWVGECEGIPLFNGEVLHRGHVLDAGVVHQDVDAAKFGLSVGHHGFDVGHLGHVRAVVAHTDAMGAARVQHFCLGAFGIAKAIENDVCALCGQLLGNAQTDAAGRASDKRSFSFQHSGLPWGQS